MRVKEIVAILDRIQHLLDDPQPSTLSWNIALKNAMAELFEKFYGTAIQQG